VERVADRVGILIDGALRVDCPTDHFKESVKKVVLEFDGRPPQFPACRGMVSSRQVGAKIELVVVGFDDEHQRLADSLSPRTMEVIDLNLEDAFIEYTRGPNRSLPSFAGEQSDANQTGTEGSA
jgi:ABC-2 type transport system ATP-binding protein